MAKKQRSAAKKISDILYNIRRRYQRAAQRYDKQASQTSGKQATYLQRAAQQLREIARKFYAHNISKAPKNSPEFKKAMKEAASKENIEASQRVLNNKRTSDDFRKEQIGRALLSGERGKRFFGITKNLWYNNGDILSYEERLNLIKQGLGVTNTLDAITKLDELFETDITNIEELGTEEFELQYAKEVRYGLLKF